MHHQETTVRPQGPGSVNVRRPHILGTLIQWSYNLLSFPSWAVEKKVSSSAVGLKAILQDSAKRFFIPSFQPF